MDDKVFDTLSDSTCRFISDTFDEARNYYEKGRVGTISKALYLQWLAGRLSGYSINCPEVGATTVCREAEEKIKKLSDKLLGYDVLE